MFSDEITKAIANEYLKNIIGEGTFVGPEGGVEQGLSSSDPVQRKKANIAKRHLPKILGMIAKHNKDIERPDQPAWGGRVGTARGQRLASLAQTVGNLNTQTSTRYGGRVFDASVDGDPVPVRAGMTVGTITPDRAAFDYDQMGDMSRKMTNDLTQAERGARAATVPGQRTPIIADRRLVPKRMSTQPTNRIETGIRDARRGIKKGILGPFKLANRISTATGKAVLSGPRTIAQMIAKRVVNTASV